MALPVTAFSAAGNRLFDEAAGIRQLSTGYCFTEGPVWDAALRCLYFTDFQENRIYRWDSQSGVTLYRTDSNRAVGLFLDAEGRIVSAETRSHGVAYADERTSTLIVGDYQGKQLNSPNDVVVSTSGDIFFTDPYSTAMGEPRVLDINGVYGVSPGGEARLVCDDMERPNGLAFSPDESVLYVNDTNRQHILAFRARADGSFSRIGVFATMDTAYGPGAPDGMKVDTAGNVYVTGPGGIWALAPDGSPLVLLQCPEFVGNLCFGGDDGRTLFLTASTSVYALNVHIPGVLPHRKEG